jgi:rubrerythrin
MTTSGFLHAPLPWRFEDLDLRSVDAAAVRDDEPLLLLLAAASFVESASHLYAGNLVEHFRPDDRVASWLGEHWEPEELQHGRALRAYVERVWPGYDWERAYRAFFEEYRALCAPEALEPLRGLELVSRCVVETGTATLYRAIARSAREPTLRALAGRISRDEIGHYRHFYRYFRSYQRAERSSRPRIAAAMVRRLLMERHEDAECGLRHAAAERYRGQRPDPARLRAITVRIRALVRGAYPYEMGAALLLKPLALSARLIRLIRPPLIVGARWFILS